MIALLAACGAGDADPRPAEATVGETRALEEAAEMLDERRLPADSSPSRGERTAPAEAPAG